MKVINPPKIKRKRRLPHHHFFFFLNKVDQFLGLLTLYALKTMLFLLEVIAIMTLSTFERTRFFASAKRKGSAGMMKIDKFKTKPFAHSVGKSNLN